MVRMSAMIDGHQAWLYGWMNVVTEKKTIKDPKSFETVMPCRNFFIIFAMIINLLRDMALREDLYVSSYMNMVFLCHVSRDKLCEKMVTEHKTLSPYPGREMVVQTREGIVASNRQHLSLAS